MSTPSKPPYAVLNYNIWIDGWLQDPRLYVYSELDDTVVIQLVDENLNAISDTLSQSITAGRTEIVIGDFLDAQQSAYGFGDGFYFLTVKFSNQGITLILPLFIALAGVSPINDDGNLHTIYLLDKVTGRGIKLPASMTTIPSSDRYLYFLYFYSDGKGRMLICDKLMNVQADTGYHKHVVMKFRLKFDNTKAMLLFMLSKAFGIPRNVFDNLYDAIFAGDYSTAVKLLTPFISIGVPDLMLSVDVDTANNEIILKTRAYLGWFEWFDNFVRGFLIGCSVGGGVGALVGSILPGIGTGSGALAGCLIGGAIGGYTEIVNSGNEPIDTPDTEIFVVVPPSKSSEFEQERDENKQKVEQHYNDAVTVLDEWLNEGKITQDDYNRMKQILDSWKITVDEIIDEYYNELINTWKEAYTKGYNDGKKKGIEESKWWIIGAGVGGLIVGAVVSR